LKMKDLRIISIYQNEVLQLGLKTIIENEYDNSEVVLVRTFDEALALMLCESFDMLIVDISEKTRGSLKALSVLRNKWPDIKVLVFTVNEISTRMAFQCLANGAHGLLYKTESVEVIIQAISTCLSGNIFIAGELKHALRNSIAHKKGPDLLHSLSRREKEIINMLLKGLSQTEVMGLLNLSQSTVSTLKSKALIKLKVKNLIELKDLVHLNGYQLA